MNKHKIAVLAVLAIMATTAVLAADNWQATLRQKLPLLGHRNWIVVVDSAYPLQTAPGIETITADADQLTVVKEVLAALAKTKHVQPNIFTDAELKFVAEKNAAGISAYREALAKILADKNVQVLPHEKIIGKLDEAGATFKILIIKTPLTLPYTSVFFQLECGYWNAASEQELRDAIKAGK